MQVSSAHRRLVEFLDEAREPLPENHGDGLRRPLDCAVINTLHDIRSHEGEPPIDTVKGVFIEGSPIYEGSGFHRKTHIQVCVVNPDCVKGVFRVPAAALG